MKRMLAGALAALMLAGFVACGSEGGSSEATPEEGGGALYTAGTYTGSAAGRNGQVTVEVTLSEDAIVAVAVTGHNETEGMVEGALEAVPAAIENGQTLAVDTVAGATITSEAIIAAAEAALLAAGVDTDALKQVETGGVAVDKTVSEEVEADIVVIGAGAAGAAAALAAAEAGANVVLLEKTASPMGASTLAGGMFAADSAEQIARGAVVDKAWLYEQYMEASNGYMNSRLVRRIIDEAGATVDWLNENGVELALMEAGSGGSFAHIGMPATLHGYQEGGTIALTKLVESFEAAGGTVYFSTPATELVYDEDGNVAGALAAKADGSLLQVNAGAVIIATGGFGGNPEMLAEFLGEPFTMGEVGQNTGEGIQMAWDAGAAEFGVGTTQYFWQTFKGEEIGALSEVLGDDWFALTAFTSLPNLRVNVQGQRFSDETRVTLYAIHGAEIAMQPMQTEFVIVDDSMLETIAQSGTAAIEEQFAAFDGDPQVYYEFNEINDTALFREMELTPTDYRPMLDGVVGTGVVFKGDTLEELAQAMGVDAESLVDSVAQYNGAIEAGRDELFFADTSRLVAVSEGPYYAIKFVARNLGTLGGVRINENIQAVGLDGEPIPGLYVAGADAGGMYGQAYVDFEGGTLGFAYTSGRLAGLQAAEEVLG